MKDMMDTPSVLRPEMSFEDKKEMQERLVERLRKDKAALENDVKKLEAALASDERGDELRSALEMAKDAFLASENAVEIAVSAEAIWKANAGLVEAKKAFDAAQAALTEHSSARERSREVLEDERERLPDVAADLATAEKKLADMVAEHDAIEAEKKAQADAQARRDAVTVRRAAAAPCRCRDCAAFSDENEAGIGLCRRKSGERPSRNRDDWCLEGVPEQAPAEVSG